MLHKTRGIVLKTTDYSESSVITQIFTEKFGLQSYLIPGVKKPKAKIKKNILQPLHLLEMVVYYKPTGSIQRIFEAVHQPAFQTIPYHIEKSSLALFLNEVLYKSIRHQIVDEALFTFLFNGIAKLDQEEKGLAIFHLYFLLHLTRFLGFYPDSRLLHEAPYFDLKEGSGTHQVPLHNSFLKRPYTLMWNDLLNCHWDDLEQFRILSSDRNTLLDQLLGYYQLHVEGFSHIKSYEVLKEIFK